MNAPTIDRPETRDQLGWAFTDRVTSRMVQAHSPDELKIDIPVWLQIDQGRGWTVDGTIELFQALRGPKKLSIGPYPPMQSRPFVEEHDQMFRWYDHWLKGIDTGVMEEPAVDVFVEGTRETITAAAWPPRDITWTPLHLRPRGCCSPSRSRWTRRTPPPTASTKHRSP